MNEKEMNDTVVELRGDVRWLRQQFKEFIDWKDGYEVKCDSKYANKKTEWLVYLMVVGAMSFVLTQLLNLIPAISVHAEAMAHFFSNCFKYLV